MAFSIANPQGSQALARNSRKIYEGPMLKQGRYNRSWRSRWFVLYNTRKLAYYNDKKESIALKPIAEIDLTKVENIVNDRSKDVQNKYVFELITSSRTFYLACLDMESLNLWEKFLLEMVFGRKIHHGWLIKKGDRIQSWRKRWFTLSNLRELRYYEDETQKKSKGTISLANVRIIRHGDKEQYGYEYTIEIITPDRTWVLVTTYHELRELWMEKLDEAMLGGIKMNLLYQGWLWKFSNIDAPIWTKKFYGIDSESLNLYYVQSYNKFKQFASTLFFDKSFYLNAVDTQLQGNLPIRHSIVEQYGNDDPQFDNTSQKSNPWIFRLRNVLGEHYFAADNELGMKEWIHHLNWALGMGPNKVVEKVTKGGMPDNNNNNMGNNNDHNGGYLDDNYLDKQDQVDQKDNNNNNNNKYDKYRPHGLPKPPPKRKKQYGKQNNKQSMLAERPIVKMHKPRNADIILNMANQNRNAQYNNNNNNNNNQNDTPPPPPPAQPQPQAQPQSQAQSFIPMNQNGGFGQNAPIMPMMNFNFGPDGMPIMEDIIPPQQPQPPQQQPNQQQHQPKPKPKPKPKRQQHQHQQHQHQHQPKPKQKQKQDNNLNPRELELIGKWSDIISPYTHSPLKLESEAQFPCNMENDYQYQYHNQNQNQHHQNMESSEMHVKCGCVERVSVLMDYYMYWMSTKQNNNDNLMGMAYLISILADYSLTELLNDFFHLKRFHAEDIVDNYLIESLSTYFQKNYGGCPIQQCVSLTRNNLNYIKCSDEKILRKWYYIDAEIIGNNELEYEEIVTQQILDMLHCYIYHGSNFSLYDTTSRSEIAIIRKIYATRKQKFNQNRYITNIHPFHHIPYKPMDMGNTPNGFDNNNNNNNNNKANNPLLEGIGNGYQQNKTPTYNNTSNKSHYENDVKYNDSAQMYEYTNSSFGVDMEHNMYQRAFKMYGPCKYYSFKQEMLSHETCALSKRQFDIISLRASILLSTFCGKLLKSRRVHDLAAAVSFELDPKIYQANEYMSEEMCRALLIYCLCEELRCSLMSTYFKITHINETDSDCRYRHYNIFYNWGKLLYTAIIAFGTDIYTQASFGNNGSFMKVKKKQKFYYHNVSKPVLFNKFNTSFYGPTSCTTSKNISLIHMPIQERDGIVLELDTNNVGWTTPFYLNISIFSNNPSECEQLFHGGASLGIHNIISVYHHKELSNLSNYTSAITLLRFIIGDTNQQQNEQQQLINNNNNNNNSNNNNNKYIDDEYAQEILDEFDQNICKHLEWLIDHQVDIFKNNKNINEFKHFSSDVPLYIALVLNSWCLNKQGIIQLNMKLLRKLPKPLQHKFVYESPDNLNDYSINWSVIFNLFPNCNKVWKRGLYFNNYLCEQYVNFLCSEHITNKKYKMDGIVFSCTAETDWKLWVTTAKKHSSIIKQMGWLITASPPKKNIYGAIETGRVSFIKRINKQ